MARPGPTNALLEGLPKREEIEIRLVENARERALLHRLLKVAQDAEQVGQSAADVRRNRDKMVR